MSKKRYYWLKLKDDFFDKKLVKKMRKIAGGDTYIIIYLKMQLMSIRSEGIIKFEEIEGSLAEELALVLDEKVENVEVTLSILQKCKAIEQISENNFLLNEVLDCIGSESDSAERKRNQRKRDKEALNKCDNVTNMSLPSHVEKEIEKDIDIDIDDRLINNKINILKEVRKKISEEKIGIISDRALENAFEKMLNYDVENSVEYLVKTIKNGVDKNE